MNAAGPVLLTVNDVAERLSLSRAKVYALIADDRCPLVAVMIPGCRSRRIRLSDLEAFVDSMTDDAALPVAS